MCQQVKNITYELTGSDLIAQLKESDEIKKHNPIFNIRQRRLGETYALTYFTNKNGIIELKINYLKSSTNVIHTYEGLKKGKDHLQNMSGSKKAYKPNKISKKNKFKNYETWKN